MDASSSAPAVADELPRELALGVIVPCRDEAAVIARKLANLASSEWPRAARSHRVVVVDDHSRDATFELAAAQRERLLARGVELDVVRNTIRPGKPGAMACGLKQLAGCVDLLVLSDSDVVIEPDALLELARAFAREPALGMACGAQRFVRAIASDGSPRAPGGAEPRDAAGLYDRLTARVRGLESRFGRLFSVHGELLAWRASLALEPTPGFAADDLDLMLQARLAGQRVRLVRTARFLEARSLDADARAAQALRRARAYVQFLRSPSIERLAAHGGWLERAQVWAYRRLPTSAPWWIPLVVAAALILAALTLPARVAWILALALAAGCASPLGRRLIRLLTVIRQASVCEREATLADRWETPRA
jgi:GT2 family glycosyltransferase